MAEREFTVVVEADEDGYLIGTVPERRGCHTQARMLDDLLLRAKEAILLCLENEEADTPALRLIGVHRIAV